MYKDFNNFHWSGFVYIVINTDMYSSFSNFVMSCYLAFVPSCFRPFVLSSLRAFVIIGVFSILNLES